MNMSKIPTEGDPSYKRYSIFKVRQAQFLGRVDQAEKKEKLLKAAEKLFLAYVIEKEMENFSKKASNFHFKERMKTIISKWKGNNPKIRKKEKYTDKLEKSLILAKKFEEKGMRLRAVQYYEIAIKYCTRIGSYLEAMDLLDKKYMINTNAEGRRDKKEKYCPVCGAEKVNTDICQACGYKF